MELSFAARLAGPELVPGASGLAEGDAARRFSVRWTPADGAVAVFEQKAPGEGKEERGLKRPEISSLSLFFSHALPIFLLAFTRKTSKK